MHSAKSIYVHCLAIIYCIKQSLYGTTVVNNRAFGQWYYIPLNIVIINKQSNYFSTVSHKKNVGDE